MMLGIDPYLVERTMEYEVSDAHEEAARDRLREAPAGEQPVLLAVMGQRLLLVSGRALAALGAWLEGQGRAIEQPLDGQAESGP
jgi:hypothetical protein